MRGKILIVDGEASLHEALEPWLQAEGYEVSSAAGADEALVEISRNSFEFVLCCYELADDRKGPLPALLVRRLPESTVLALTPSGKEERSRAILEWGVYDCVEKPVVQVELVMALRRAEERQLHRRETSILTQDVQRLVGDRPLVAASPQMIEVLEATERVAAESYPLLLVGERGTGREILARATHSQSDRRRSPFAVMPCRGSEMDVDARLFGHARDAAPGGARLQRGLLAEANGGTVYFDEISALPTSTQLRLVSLLTDGEIRALGDAHGRSVDLRVIATTSQLDGDARPLDIHSELLSLLSQREIRVPALRDRPHDIPLLVDHFFARAQMRQNKPLRAIADEVLERLVTHQWPGNLEELESVIHRAVMLARGERVTLDDLPREIVAPESSASDPAADYGLKRARKQVEAQLIRRALGATGGNRTHAAKLLEISHRALLYKLKEYGIND